MISGSAKRAIDTAVHEAIPLKWLQSFKEPGEQLDDLMGVDAISLLDKHRDHLLEIVKDAISHLKPRWGTKLPADWSGSFYFSLKQDVLSAYDALVDYIMVWSKKMGYDTCKGRTYDSEDVDPFTFNILDQGGALDDFFYIITDPNFYMATSKWVAEQLYLEEIITQETISKLVNRAEQQL